MKTLAVLPFFAGILLLLTRPAEKTLLWLVFPMLLAMPTYYYFPLIGLPDFNFFHFAILPLFGWWLLHGRTDYRFGQIDFFVFAYAGVSVLSEFTTMNAKDGINLMIDRTVQIIIPFLLLKHFFSQTRLRIPIFKVMTVIGAIMAFFSPLEFKFDLAVVDWLQWVWPEHLRWPGWPRYGYVRAAAVYGHPIIAGMMWSFFTLFAIWLHKQRVWNKIWHGGLVILLNLSGVAMSISRGPMLGLLAGLILLIFGWSKNRIAMIMFLLACSIIVLPPVVSKFIEYASIDRYSATTETQKNVAYRKELLDNYIEEIKKRPWLGYGRNGLPIVKGQRSIDNQYVYIALLHGTIALALFAIITIIAVLRMLYLGLKLPQENITGQLAWLFIACAGTWLVTLATVWMGAQSEQMIFMLLAMISALGLEGEQGKLETLKKNVVSTGWQFQRTL